MTLLLDTHVLLALLEARADSLGRAVAAAVLNDDRHTFSVSVATLWEIAIKWRLGKLPLGVAPARLPELLADMGLATLPITASHALAAVEPEPSTRDPFDRLLLAVCLVDDLRLLTVDRALVAHHLAMEV